MEMVCSGGRAVSFFLVNLRGMRWLAIISGVVVLGVLALGVHIYVVTRPHADGHSRGMARIDLHQKIGGADCNRITAWLSRQKGVDHVLVNPGSAIAVFTYTPMTANPAAIVKSFRDSLPYHRAERYLPAAAEVRRGCPMTAMPVTNAMYTFLKRLF
jgi:hypothetical protein